jgi:hypothetical protein
MANVPRKIFQMGNKGKCFVSCIQSSHVWSYHTWGCDFATYPGSSQACTVLGKNHGSSISCASHGNIDTLKEDSQASTSKGTL